MDATKHNGPLAGLVKTCALSGCLLCALFALLYHFFPYAAFLSLAITAGTTGYHFVMRLAVGWVVPTLTRGRLNPDSFWFRQRPFERKLHRFLRVRRWKGKMPTYNPEEFYFGKNTPEQIIQNSCVAELVHEVIFIASFLPVFAIRFWGAPAVFLITSLLAAGVDCCFVLMQRYNRPRLQNYHRRMAKRIT